jgi:uncharacterized protein
MTATPQAPAAHAPAEATSGATATATATATVGGHAAQPMLVLGQVRHTRHTPRHHAFAYPTYGVLLPLRALQEEDAANQCNRVGLGWNRRAWMSWFDQDHGDGRSPAQGGALAWLDETLAAHGIHDATGEVWLHCYPRVLGFAFKPVSFWYCHSASGQLRAVMVEVNNTFGERHCYLLDPPRWGHTLVAAKVFHVSPFCAVQGRYQFCFMRSDADAAPAAGQRLVARVELQGPLGPIITTSVSGVLTPLTPQTLRQALWQHPLLSVAVVVRIHWQALRLWWLRVPFFRKPMPPQHAVSHITVPPISS